MNREILELLYRSFDADLSVDEQSRLEQALSMSSDLQKEKTRIAELRKTISDNAIRSFKPFFSARVMNQLQPTPATSDDFSGTLLWAFRRIAFGGVIAIALLLFNNFLIEKNHSLEAMLGVPRLNLEDTWQLENVIAEDNQ